MVKGDFTAITIDYDSDIITTLRTTPNSYVKLNDTFCLDTENIESCLYERRSEEPQYMQIVYNGEEYRVYYKNPGGTVWIGMSYTLFTACDLINVKLKLHREEKNTIRVID